MQKNSTPQSDIVQFLRKRDYILVKELGQGGCGKTVLLRDPQIDELLVCKKYVPYSAELRQELFANFVREIKLLYNINHPNIVRVFNYYLYPDNFAGYILMEFIDGSHVDDYLTFQSEKVNEVFQKVVAGFAYLERTGILHRDIRPANIMVQNDGTVKIIDLGFGKRITGSKDFKKSISLNWWCAPPNEFSESRYDFGTEVYFVGKLFEAVIADNEIKQFQYVEILRRMCQKEPSARISSFATIEQEVGSNRFIETTFPDTARAAYRAFADAVCQQITKIQHGAKYVNDPARILTQLEDAYRRFTLEKEVPDAAVVLRCLLAGTYYYRKAGLLVPPVRSFVKLLKNSTDEQNKLIIANLHTRFDAIPRYSEPGPEDDDVPF
jgi:serine/threonine-protein kinase